MKLARLPSSPWFNTTYAQRISQAELHKRAWRFQCSRLPVLVVCLIHNPHVLSPFSSLTFFLSFFLSLILCLRPLHPLHHLHYLNVHLFLHPIHNTDHPCRASAPRQLYGEQPQDGWGGGAGSRWQSIWSTFPKRPTLSCCGMPSVKKARFSQSTSSKTLMVGGAPRLESDSSAYRLAFHLCLSFQLL